MHYSERLRVPLRWWVQSTMLLASLWLAVAVAAPLAVSLAVTGVLAALIVAALLTYGGAVVEVRDGVFRAGRAHIDVALLGTAEPLDASATRRAAGVEADARAYLLLRPYLKRAVRVAIEDPQDPAPYWLVSTRRPDTLVAALRDAAPATGPGGSTPR